MPGKLGPSAVLFGDNKKHLLKVEVYEAWIRRPAGVPILQAEQQLARQFHVSVSTVRRYITEIGNHGYQPRIKSKQGRKVYAWDEEAINFLKAFYITAQREVGYCTARNAYNKTCEAAKQKGWRVGSEQSAYVHLRDIHSLLLTYATGGSRALDNIFYIARDLSLLAPFQVVVGDQHPFNFWCLHNGKEVRATCYAWIDMRTRLLYGIDFAPGAYNHRNVARSLKMGLLRFGKFNSTYNDNGAPETSGKIDRLVHSLQTYGMHFKDNSELYRTQEGTYALESPEGQVVATVDNAQEWRRENRRMFAQVKNAKAKPIERFFRTLDILLLDACLPGYTRNIKASAAEDEEATRRLNYQREHGYFLTYEEFIDRVKEAIIRYENRDHTGLGHSPLEELHIAQDQQGWEPVWIDEKDIRFIFLESERRVVKGNRVCINGINFVGPSLTQDMIRNNRDNLVGLSGKKIEVFFDPDDPEAGVWAVDPRDGQSIYLQQEKKIHPFNSDDLAEQMEEKRANMKAVSGTFRETTKQIGTVLSVPVYKPLIEAKEETVKNIEDASAKRTALTETDFQTEVASLLTKELAEKPKRQPVYQSPRDRYKAVVDAILQGISISQQDQLFKTDYEESLTEEERVHWTIYIHQQGGKDSWI